MQLTQQENLTFQNHIWDYYARNGRQFLWRHNEDPYAVLISEVMLQQTQTARVVPKFERWMIEFPGFQSLAQASLRDVLCAWQGLGYNRRALFLQKTAQIISKEYASVLPADPNLLLTLPGIGKNTAGSICAFAFNMPTVFIETNIRAVYLHSFFPGKEKVKDNEIETLVAQTIDKRNPREWYYALMDYGVALKQQLVNPSRKSAHHAKQSKFEGSHRQIRGAILRLLAQQGTMRGELFKDQIKRKPEEIHKALHELIHEGFIACKDNSYSIVTE